MPSNNSVFDVAAANPRFEDPEKVDEPTDQPKRRSIEAHVAPTLGGLGGAQVPSPVDFDDVVEVNDFETKNLGPDGEPLTINMWKFENVGLYAHFAAVGLLTGMAGGTSRTACVYIYNGAPQYCQNITSLVFLAWNLKIFYAVITDVFWPFGMHRKPYMVAAWSGVLALTLFLGFFYESLTAESFGLLMLLMQAIFMLGNVPADGYSVELAEYEEPHHRGQILATGQATRFFMGIVTNMLQSFLLNGPATNRPTQVISLFEGWTWGLTLGEFFIFSFFFMGMCFIPILFLKEVDNSDTPRRTVGQLFGDMWVILQSKTSMYLIIYGALMRAVAGANPATYGYMQYFIIGIPNLMAGVESMMAYLFLTLAVLTFKKYLINKNWRYINYFSEVVATAYSFIWFLAFYNVNGLRNGWFTVFINISSEYIEGLTQVLLSVAVIEISKKGMEATTYELIISITNSCITLATILAVQFTGPLGVTKVDLDNGFEGFDETDGGNIFAFYTSMIMVISIIGLIIATRFLPTDREMCHRWKEEGEASGNEFWYGVGSLSIAVACIGYGLLVSFFYFDPNLSCQEWVGGRGCD